MDIAIIGAGKVGSTLGKLWAAQGHNIIYGVRNPEQDSVKEFARQSGPNSSVTYLAAAVAAANVVLLAVPSAAIADVIADGGEWDGKIIIDPTNRLTPPPPDSTGSVAGDIARLAAGARVVKAFNIVGMNRYGSPAFGNQVASMLICGDDGEAKQVASDLAAGLGWEVIDAGPLENAALLESLGRLWVYFARSTGNREHAFKLLRD